MGLSDVAEAEMRVGSRGRPQRQGECVISVQNCSSGDQKFLVVTNNQLLAEKEKYPVDLVAGSSVDVLVRAILLLQSGYRLVSAPLPPSVPTARVPFRSLILEKSGEKYDIAGIETVERARKAMAKQRATGGVQEEGGTGMSEKAEDFTQIDEECLERALRDYLLVTDDSN